MNNSSIPKSSRPWATLIRTFKTEYQPPTGGTTEQEIIQRFPALLCGVGKKVARRNSDHHFSVLLFIRLKFYDIIQLAVKKLAERI